jgi:uncharacterized protein (TIGR02246 family)
MSGTLEPARAREFVARLHAAVNAHDAEAVAALCTEDVNWMDPAATVPLRGREAVERFHREGLFRALPDVRIELIDGPYVSMNGAAIAVRTAIRGTMRGTLDPPGFAPTGMTVGFETAEFSQLRDGLLARHIVIFDMLDLARQIGALPRSGSVGERVGVAMQHCSAAVIRRRARRRRDPP